MADDPLAGEIAALATPGVSLDGRRCSELAAYARLVMKWQRIVNLTGASSAEQFVREHVADCLAVAPFIDAGRVLDVGSGAGLPGVVLALARPDLEITLLEPRARRARFLTQARIELALSNVEVVCARLESYQPQRPFNTIITRAFGSLAAFIDAAAALRGAGTRLLAMKAAPAVAEVVAAEALAGRAHIETLNVPGYSDRTLVIFGAAPAAPGAARDK